MEQYSVLDSAANYAFKYLDGLRQRRVYPDEVSLQDLKKLPLQLPESNTDAEEVIRLLKRSPPWVPASQFGRNVKVYRKQPVTFMVTKS